MSIAVREARPEEYQAMGRLTVEAYREFAAALSPEGWAHYRGDLADIVGRAPRGAILVAEWAGQAVGTVSYYAPTQHTEVATWTWWPQGFAYLRALAVAPSARGHGAGRALAQAGIERARREGASGVALNTMPQMTVAQGMYERLGFQAIAQPSTVPGGMKVFSYVLQFSDVPIASC